MRILMYEWAAYTQGSINRILTEHHIQLDSYTHIFTDKYDDPAFESSFAKKLKENKYDAVCSINYFPLIAMLCYKSNVKYISWSYDNPLNVKNIEDTLGLPTNYVFLFDKLQVRKYTDMGFDNVWHLPLACDTAHFSRITVTPADYQKYHSAVSFVGTLYESTYPKLISPLNDYQKGYLDSIVNLQTDLYGCYLVDELLNPDFINSINKEYQKKISGSVFSVSREALSYSIATQITHKERLTILALLSGHLPVTLYSDQSHPILDKVKQPGYIDYQNIMPKIFKCSDINLNMTLKILQSGIPLRAMDILGCGGFLLTNFQEEYLDYFEDGKDLVIYENAPDALEKAMYYASHKKEQDSIAKNGYEKVCKYFTYEERFETIRRLL